MATASVCLHVCVPCKSYIKRGCDIFLYYTGKGTDKLNRVYEVESPTLFLYWSKYHIVAKYYRNKRRINLLSGNQLVVHARTWVGIDLLKRCSLQLCTNIQPEWIMYTITYNEVVDMWVH